MLKDVPTIAWMPALALLLPWVGPIACMAQPPGPPASARPAAVPPAAGSRATPGDLDLPPALPAPRPFAPGAGALVPPETGPSPLAAHPTLRPAPFAPNDLRFPINLATALRLSDARPLIVAAAQARVWV